MNDKFIVQLFNVKRKDYWGSPFRYQFRVRNNPDQDIDVHITILMEEKYV